ncbi:glucose-6-phosphate 1-dehydrogenase [Streptomyces malaysiensis]|uniref:Glucose-6-phosphate 1-dehydrogenase n=1 Tax=Streptomyces malaysiensis TaxID=92644 RepID=A0A7X5X9Y9_STRMQ|nr:glucose-6-phosphate 1-dehydrogenase [Streptomyces malaysiensis]
MARLNGTFDKTYQEMAVDCDFKRSVTWWNKVRWEEIGNPPEPRVFPYLAKALEVPVRRVAEMVAEQWCGVRPDDTVPEHLRSLLAVLRGISPEDVPAVEQLAQMLSDKYTAELLVKSFEPKPEEHEEDGGGGPYTVAQLRSLTGDELRRVAMDVPLGRTTVEDDPEAYALLDAVAGPVDE